MNLNELTTIKSKFDKAIENRCSDKWCLTLWSRLIKARDHYSCVNCSSTEHIQAHHIFRKTTYPKGKFATGNGITLCIDCHHKVHAEFNGRPELNEPLGAEGGDDQDEMAYLYGILLENAEARKLSQNEFYYFPDDMLLCFVRFQGYEELYWEVQKGTISRLYMAHHIWRVMPQLWYRNIVGKIFELNNP